MARSFPWTQCYVWEWQREDGGFSPYPADVIQLLEEQFHRARSGSKGSFFDLQLLPNSAKQRHPLLQENIVDFAAMEQVHRESGYRCPVRRCPVHLPSVAPCGGEWSWDLGHGMFVLYDVVSMLVIEAAYQSRNSHGRQDVDLSRTPASLPYTISFQAVAGYMCQTRHGFNTQRRVTRFPLDQPLQAYLCGTAQGQPPNVSPLAAALPPTQPYSRTAHQYVPQAAPPTTSVSGTYRGSSMSNSRGVPSVTAGGPQFVTHPPPASATGGVPQSLTHPPPASATGGVPLSRTHPPLASATGGVPQSWTHPPPASATGGVPQSWTHPPPASATEDMSQSIFAAATQPPPASSTAAGQDEEGCSLSTHSKREETALASAPQWTQFLGSNVPPLDPSMATYVSTVLKLSADEDEPCPVCLCKLSEPSDYQTADLGLDLVQMLKCSHRLHRLCFQQYLSSQTSRNGPSGIRCPTCKKIHGVKIGDMPKEYGSMHVRRTRFSLPGYEEFGCIEITYSFRRGRDRTGQPFSTHGFPRVCYLPDCPKGQRVLRLLQVAWDRRLTFTIGTSVTTGASNTVVWNEIHHKTECHGNISGHGYPDPNYLDNVLMELESQGVTDDDEE